MMAHKCNKEREIAVIQTDVNWVKTEQIEVKTDVKKILQILTEGEGKISAIKKELYGNGDPTLGIKHRLKQIEETHLKVKGGMLTIKIICGILLFLNSIIGYKFMFGG